MEYEDLLLLETEWHDYAADLTEKFASWINAHTSYRVHVEWLIGFLAYFKRSKINDPRIRFDKCKLYNHSFYIGSVLFETDKPYYLNCWKAEKSSDLLSMGAGDESLCFASLSEKDFPYLWSIVSKFFGFPEVRYEQMDLFSCLGV